MKTDKIFGLLVLVAVGISLLVTATNTIGDVSEIYNNCSQEQTDLLTYGDCADGLTYEGTYTVTATGTCQDSANVYDGDPTTLLNVFPGATCLLTSNYTIPTSLTNGAIYSHTIGSNSYLNVSIPEACLTGTVLSVQMFRDRAGVSYTACYNQTQYINMSENTINTNALYEENVYWGGVQHVGNDVPYGSIIVIFTVIVFVMVVYKFSNKSTPR